MNSAGQRVGELLDRRFRVLRLIGEGGMGVVYEVLHEITKQRGALKLLRTRYATQPSAVRRFINEASAAGRIKSRHVVTTYDAGQLNSTGEPYMFMEYLEGSPLSRHLGLRGQLCFEDAFEVVCQVADGLSEAHAAGIVHRDIKSDNLFLVEAATPFVKILDFGISKFNAVGSLRTSTAEGVALGTPSYMPAEQFMGQRDLDHRADIYSLGVVLYELLAGRLPYETDTVHRLCLMICEGNYTPLSRLRPDAPPGFDAVLARALAVDREARFASAAAFKAALQHLPLPAPGAQTGVTTIPGLGAASRTLRGLPPHAPRLANTAAFAETRDCGAPNRQYVATPMTGTATIVSQDNPRWALASSVLDSGAPQLTQRSLASQVGEVEVRPPAAASEHVILEQQAPTRLRRPLLALTTLALLGGLAALGWSAIRGEEAPLGERQEDSAHTPRVEEAVSASSSSTLSNDVRSAAQTTAVEDHLRRRPTPEANEVASDSQLRTRPASALPAGPRASTPRSESQSPPAAESAQRPTLRDGLDENNPFD